MRQPRSLATARENGSALSTPLGRFRIQGNNSTHVQCTDNMSKRQMKSPMFFLHDAKDRERLDPSSGWLPIHEQIVDTISNSGYQLEIVPRGSEVPRNMNGIFIGKHTRLNEANCWNVKKSYLPGYFYFDRTGYSGWAQMANDKCLFERALAADQTAADTFFESLYASTAAANQSKTKQSEEPFINPPRPFVFLPLQLSFDSVMRLSRIEHYRFYEAVRDWSAKQELDLVIKPHPASKGDLVFGRDCESTKRILDDAKQQRYVHPSNASIHYILPKCEAVFCINSGVGFEALIHKKSVITVGHSDYHWATHSISRLDEIPNNDSWREPAIPGASINRFLYFFLSEYLVDIRHSITIQQRITVAVREFLASLRQ